MSPLSGKAPLLLIWVDHLASTVLFTESLNISLSSHFPSKGLNKSSPRDEHSTVSPTSTVVHQLCDDLSPGRWSVPDLKCTSSHLKEEPLFYLPLPI